MMGKNAEKDFPNKSLFKQCTENGSAQKMAFIAENRQSGRIAQICLLTNMYRTGKVNLLLSVFSDVKSLSEKI